MIYCIWYPSGGFGHWINSIVSVYGVGFCRPIGTINFSADGNSHHLPLVLPKYHPQIKKNYTLPNIDSALNYTVLIDNGIDDESPEFQQFFQDCPIIKICYSDKDWPVLAQTYVTKAMKSDMDAQMPTGSEWCTTDPWAKREKFFLSIRDSPLRSKWRSDPKHFCLAISDMMHYQQTLDVLGSFGITMADFRETWHSWWAANQQYFAPIQVAQKVIRAVQHKERLDLSAVKDIWTQSVIYYYIWIEYQQEVPHNDFSDFFSNTDQIREWLAV